MPQPEALQKIIFLLSDLSLGGSELKTIRVANELYRRGYSVCLSYLNPPEALLPELEAYPVLFLNRKGKYGFGVSGKLRNYINKNRVSHIWCVNEYPTLYLRNVRARVFCCLNTTEHRSIKDKLLMATVFAPILRRLDMLVFGCEYQKSIWVKRFHLDPQRCNVIYNGVDEKYFSLSSVTEDPRAIRARYGFTDRDIVLCMVAQLRPEKRHLDLIRVCARLHNDLPVRALLVGDGPMRAKIQSEIERNRLSQHVHLVGHLSDVRFALAASDIFILTSSSETFSNAALEAMSMSKPIIMSETGGATEMITPGVNGYVFRSGDLEGISRRIHDIVSSGDVHKMGGESRRLIEEKFSFSQMLDKYLWVLSRSKPN